MSLSIQNQTKRATPKVKFEKIQEHVLGKKYELSLVLCGNALTHKLNLSWRGKDNPTNVLAFPLSETSGEIFINLSKTEPFGVAKLFIHALLHLKGMEHGDTMEKAEEATHHVASHRRWN